MHKEGESVCVRIEREERLRVPLHNLQGIVTFGNVLCSPFLLGHAAQGGVAISMLSNHGRFLAYVSGPQSGNVLLRRTQYRWADDPERTASVVRSIVAGKVANARQVLLRALRDNGENTALTEAAIHMKGTMSRLDNYTQTADQLRGMEGDSGKVYFGVFNELITQQKADFAFAGRSRRPPLDRVNALLSFIYTLLYHELAGAIQSVGLDVQAGFLHRDRPGRSGLALDLMEEMRAFWGDRLALSLINRRQLSIKHFRVSDSGGVFLNDKGRKIVLETYQKRKQDEVIHPFTNERMPLGLIPFIQAQLLARHLRGDLDAYPPFFWR
jgi:CRISPR-associated protein Cas1